MDSQILEASIIAQDLAQFLSENPGLPHNVYMTLAEKISLLTSEIAETIEKRNFQAK